MRNNTLSFSVLRQVYLAYVVPNYERRVLLQCKHDKQQALYDAAVSETTNVLSLIEGKTQNFNIKRAQSSMHYATSFFLI